MKGVYLKFYVTERSEHEDVLLYEWLLEQAKKLGLHGGTAMRAAAGYGRHGKLHEETFFELAADLPVEVGFALTEEDANRLLAVLKEHKLEIFYVKFPIEFGILGTD